MNSRWLRATAPGLAVVLLSCVAAHACPAVRGTRIVLEAQSMDPDVFVWDSAQRLVNYTNGAYLVDTVLKHTTLAPAGTPAVFLSCRRSPSGAPTAIKDMLKVRVFIQARPPETGWVSAEDARWLSGKPILPVSP